MDFLHRKFNQNEWLSKLAHHLRNPLYRNGYALVASSILTSAIGMGYWIFAARKYVPDVVGVNSTLISTMGFLANLSMLNMGNLLNRFVPSAGKHTLRLILITYGLSIAISAAVGAVFLLGQNTWAPSLSTLRIDARFGMWFIASTVLWSIFVLQDSVLTGLRQALWVPIENLVFAVLKVVLLFMLAPTMPNSGIFLSWTIPVIVVVPTINLLIFGRMVPAQVRSSAESGAPLTLRRGAAFIGADYLSSLVMMTVVDLLPLFVIERVGAAATAYFYLAWTISYTLYLVTRNMGNSLIAEAAANERKLNLYTYKILVQILRLVVPTAVVMAVGAPLILQIFGSDYSAEASTLLSLLALSAIPNVVTALYVSILRVRFQMVRLIVMMLVLCAMIVGLSIVLLEIMGITGIGVAWLVSESVIAVILLLTEMRPLWISRGNLRYATDLKNWMADMIDKSPERDRHLVEAQLPQLIEVIQSQSELKETTDWQVLDQLALVKDGAAYYLGPQDKPSALLKLSGSPSSLQSLAHHISVLQEIHALPEFNGWGEVLPNTVAQGKLGDQLYVVETLLPGINAVEALGRSISASDLLPILAQAIQPLHQQTSQMKVVDAELFDEWVRDPICLIKGALRRPSASLIQTLNRLENELSEALLGKCIRISWIHGDYAPENILVDQATFQVTGIVDWELARPNALSEIDQVWLMIATQLHLRHEELGSLVVKLLNDDKDEAVSAVYSKISELCMEESGDNLTPRTLILLTWLHHISANLHKAERYRTSWFWLSRNVENVLFYL